MKAEKRGARPCLNWVAGTSLQAPTCKILVFSGPENPLTGIPSTAMALVLHPIYLITLLPFRSASKRNSTAGYGRCPNYHAIVSYSHWRKFRPVCGLRDRRDFERRKGKGKIWVKGCQPSGENRGRTRCGVRQHLRERHARDARPAAAGRSRTPTAKPSFRHRPNILTPSGRARAGVASHACLAERSDLIRAELAEGRAKSPFEEAPLEFRTRLSSLATFWHLNGRA